MNVQTENDFLRHSKLTDPGPFSAQITDLPRDATSLVEIVSGWFVHSDFLELYGLGENSFSTYTRATLSLADCLEHFSGTDGPGLEAPRPFSIRLPATCRDYAVMLCGLFREKGVRARVRCGFACYFEPGKFEDHWVCEYADNSDWRIADAQLDDEHRAHLSICFDQANVPKEQFWTADRAWAAWRAGKADAKAFGHGDAFGPQFLMINLVRDFLAVTAREVSSWDLWRQALPLCSDLSAVQLADCDALAEAVTDATGAGRMPAVPEGLSNLELEPFW